MIFGWDIRTVPTWRVSRHVFGGVLIISLGRLRLMRVVED